MISAHLLETTEAGDYSSAGRMEGAVDRIDLVSTPRRLDDRMSADGVCEWGHSSYDV
jgi:hypothetical protein